MWILSRQSLRRQIVAAAFLLLLPFVLAVVISGERTFRERETEVRREAASTATTAASYLDEYLNSLNTLASVLVRHPAVFGGDAAAANGLFSSVRSEQPLLTNVTLVDIDGLILASGLPLQDGRMSQRWFYDVVTADAPQIGSFMIGAVSGKPTVMLGYPVRKPGEKASAALGLSIDLTQLQTVLSQLPLPSGSVVTVTDRPGRILVRSVDAARYIGQTFTPIDWPGTPTTADRRDVDGVMRLTGDAALTRAPWIISVGIPRSEVIGRLRGLWSRNLAIVAGAFLASMLLSLWLASLMSRHLEQLRTAAQRIAAGDLSSPVSSDIVPTRELADLQTAFTSMATNLRVTRDTLDRQMEQERTLNDALQSLQRQVVRQERLAAVGLLASGLAHELNNPLQAIVGATHLLERNASLDSAALTEVGFVRIQSDRAVGIIRSLERFGRHRHTELAMVDLLEVAEDVMRLQSTETGKGAVPMLIAPGRVRPVSATFAELEQVVLNFVINARQSTALLPPGQGRVDVRLTEIGRWVRLEVRDNGPGVRPEDEAKLFQPFFTTKSVGEGTGLGLSVSYGIIHSYGGTIGYTTNEWGGATFFFELPGHEIDDDVSAHDTPPVLRRPL